MCKCTPAIKTPFCGQPGCEWPDQKVGEFAGFKVLVREDIPTDVIIMAPENYTELLVGGQRKVNQIGVIKRALEGVKRIP